MSRRLGNEEDIVAYVTEVFLLFDQTLITHRMLLRPGLVFTIRLPANFSPDEAIRLGNAIRTYPLEK